MKEELFAVNLIIRGTSHHNGHPIKVKQSLTTTPANAVALFGEQEYAVLTRLDKHNRWTAMVSGEEEDHAVIMSGGSQGDLEGAMMSLLRGTSRKVAEAYDNGNAGAGPSGAGHAGVGHAGAGPSGSMVPKEGSKRY